MLAGSSKAEAIATVVTVAIIAGIILNEIMVVTSAEMQTTMRAAEHWCNGLGGNLSISRVIGQTGGIHCQLPNGTLVEYK